MHRNGNSSLESIREKVELGERLSFDDGMLLYDPETPLQEVGQLANQVRERKNGNVAYYNINTHLNIVLNHFFFWQIIFFKIN